MSETATQQPEATSEQPRKSSGYRRLQVRHRTLIEQNESLQRDYYALLDQQRELQQDVDRLLAEHQRLMQRAKAPSPKGWFEGANLSLAQLAAAPEPRALQVMTAALAGVQQRLAQIIMRVTP